MTMLADLGPLDYVAFTLLFAAWAGYEWLGSRAAARGRNLAAHMKVWRERWMEAVLERDNRILDVQIIRSLVGNSSFLASTSIFVIGGLAAVLGASAEIVPLLNKFDYFAATTQNRFGVKVLLLMLIFMHAFFRLAWSMRLHNNAAVVLGSIPQPGNPATAVEAEAYAQITARLVTLAARHYNAGTHAYYFGLAAVAWFIHPVALMATTAWVVAILYRREFLSRAHAVLRTEE